MRGRVGMLACVLVGVVLVLVSVGCGGSSGAVQGSILKSVPPDPQAVVHTYAAQGFSLAFGPGWQASYKRVPVSSATSSQSAVPVTAWELSRTSPFTSGSVSGVVLLTVMVVPEPHAVDPSEFRDKAEKVATSFGASVQELTLSGVPAIYTSGQSSLDSSETITLASGSKAYVLHADVPGASWGGAQPRLLAVMRSFTLLPVT